MFASSSGKETHFSWQQGRIWTFGCQGLSNAVWAHRASMTSTLSDPCKGHFFLFLFLSIKAGLLRVTLRWGNLHADREKEGRERKRECVHGRERKKDRASFMSYGLSEKYCVLVCSEFWKQHVCMYILYLVIDKLDIMYWTQTPASVLHVTALTRYFCAVEGRFNNHVECTFLFLPLWLHGDVLSGLLCSIPSQCPKFPHQYTYAQSFCGLICVYYSHWDGSRRKKKIK